MYLFYLNFFILNRKPSSVLDQLDYGTCAHQCFYFDYLLGGNSSVHPTS